jgi:hypothetical protein
MKNLKEGGHEFLNRHFPHITKWAPAYDEGEQRYGHMTSNMAECFNNMIRGVRALPMTTIVQYTFDKMNEYFMHYSLETNKQIVGK